MKKKIIESKEIRLILEKIAKQFFDENKKILRKEGAGVVGIHTRGVFLATRLAEILKKKYSLSISTGSLDITLYRDDVGEISNQPLVKETDIPFHVDGKIILLVDDVLYTGRTIRAALDALLELGRPKLIRLAVLVDRDSRELPVQADYVGTKLVVGAKQKVQLKIKELDGDEGVWIAMSSISRRRTK